VQKVLELLSSSTYNSRSFQRSWENVIKELVDIIIVHEQVLSRYEKKNRSKSLPLKSTVKCTLKLKWRVQDTTFRVFKDLEKMSLKN